MTLPEVSDIRRALLVGSNSRPMGVHALALGFALSVIDWILEQSTLFDDSSCEIDPESAHQQTQ
jgi:hypothetical protein